MKILALAMCLLCGGFLVWSTADFPPWGDPNSPASLYLSPHYIQKTLEETSVPNMVTAVLADYRGFDTMFETTVIFCAGMACFMLLRTVGRPEEIQEALYRHLPSGVILHVKKGYKLKGRPEDFERIDSQWTPRDVIIQRTCRFMIPFIQLFALYVVAHGHHSPGGGFQGGVILGAALILLALSFDLRTAQGRLPEAPNGLLNSAGIFIYVGTGALCLLWGGNFLDYAVLAPIIGVDPIQARSLGILVVEIGVAMAVMATMMMIYRNVSSAGAGDEGL